MVGACCAICLCTNCFAVSANSIRNQYGIGETKDVRLYQERLAIVQEELSHIDSIRARNDFFESLDTQSLTDSINRLTQSAYSLRVVAMSSMNVPIEDLTRVEESYYSTMGTLEELVLARNYLMPLEGDVEDEAYSLLTKEIDELIYIIGDASVFEDIGKAGVYPLPEMEYKVNSEFGTRWDPVTKSAYTFHQGLDLKAPYGSKVVAAFSGVVHAAGNSYNSGNYIYLDHGDGVMTFYCHLSEILVAKGDTIQQGQLIALSGNTGARTTGPHLHFGVYIDGKPYDPRKVLEW